MSTTHVAARRRSTGPLRRRLLTLLAAVIIGAGSVEPASGDQAAGAPDDSFVVLTFNVGTTPKLPHDQLPDDGYGLEQARISDAWYGNGLAWRDAIEAVQRFVRLVDPDVVAFQEIFFCPECPNVPPAARQGFICETWTRGEKSVAAVVLGDDFQIAYHRGRPSKCLAVHRRFGVLRANVDDDGVAWLEGAKLAGCGSGARVARGFIERASGETVTVISLHGTSGMAPKDQTCRVRQVEQIFVDFGDGAPAVRGERNLILGDFNTDPARAAPFDMSARRWNDFVGPGKPFQFVTKVGFEAPRAYQGIADIDHVVSDAYHGTCQYPGVDEGSSRVFNGVYFDHTPVVCRLSP